MIQIYINNTKVSNIALHIIIAALSFVLLLSTLLIPSTVYNWKDLEHVQLGHPFTFITQNLNEFDPPSFPRSYRIDDPREHSISVNWIGFALSYVTFVGIGELIVKAKQNWRQKRKSRS